MNKQIGNRLTSLDAFRGFAIVAMLLVNQPSAELVLAPWLRHGTRFEPTFADLVYPFFLFIIGVSLEISNARRRAAGISFNTRFLQALRRSVTLIIIGLALLSLSYHTLRFNTGTLQAIGVAYLLAFPFTELRVSYRALAITLVYGTYILLALNSDWSELVESIDGILLLKPRGIEGVIPTLIGATVIMWGSIVGYEISSLPQDKKLPDKKLLKFSLLGATLVAFAYILQNTLHVPLITDLFTPSFALLAVGLSITTLTVFMILFDRLPLKLLAFPLIIFGMNALPAYIFSRLLRLLILNQSLGDAGPTLREWMLSSTSPPIYLGLVLGLNFLFCLVLWRRRIFIRV